MTAHHTRRALLAACLGLLGLLPGCHGCGAPRGSELVSRGSGAPARDPAAELWALGHPDAHLGLVIPDLRPLAGRLEDLRVAALAAPQGPAAVAHLEGLLRGACPGCPRRAGELEPRGVGAGEGLALFLGPGEERVLAVGCLRTEAVLGLLETWLRRGDHTVRRRELPRGGERLTVLEGTSPWYCRRSANRLVCGSAPTVLEAALARPRQRGLWQARVQRRFPREEQGAAVSLYHRGLADEQLASLRLAPDRAALRLAAWPAPVPAPASTSSLLGLADGADGLVRLQLPGARLAEELPRAALPGLGAPALAAELTGEVLLLQRGRSGLALALGLRDGRKLEPQLTVILRALQLLRFTQRLRSSPGKVELTEVGREELQGHPALRVRARVSAGELLGLPLELKPEQSIYLALGPDCLIVTNELELAKRAVEPSQRPPPWRGEGLVPKTALGPGGLFVAWSRTVDPFAGLPPELVSALLARALAEHDDLAGVVQTGRYLADLGLDLSAWLARDGDHLVGELALRPLHVDDEAHRRARPHYLAALQARHQGKLDLYRDQLAAVIARHGGTRYAERASRLAAGDPLTLLTLAGLAAHSAGGELRRLLQVVSPR